MRTSGFTLIEMVVTLALVGVVALTALPLYEVTATHLREIELRHALRTLRAALDAYKTAVDMGQISKGALETGYPASLEALVNGVESTQVTPGGRARIVFLRQIPRDPFAAEPAAPAADQWSTRAYGTPPGETMGGSDVFDVASRSTRVGTNGVPYNRW